MRSYDKKKTRKTTSLGSVTFGPVPSNMEPKTPPKHDMVTTVGAQDGNKALTSSDPMGNQALENSKTSLEAQDSSMASSTLPVLKCSSTGQMGIVKGPTIESGALPANSTLNAGFLTGDASARDIRNQLSQNQFELTREKMKQAARGITDPNTLRELLEESIDREANLGRMIASDPSLKASVPVTADELNRDNHLGVMSSAPRVIEPSGQTSQPVQSFQPSINSQIEQVRNEMTQMQNTFLQQMSMMMERLNTGNERRAVEQVVHAPEIHQAPDTTKLLLDAFRESQKTQERTNRITQQGHYLTVMSSLSILHGDEGPSRIAAYFRNFENITAGWDSYFKANLIATRLQGQARLLYDALGEDEQMSYEIVKDSVLNGGASADSLRAQALSQLSRRLVQGPNESFLNFGKRLLRVTRDSLLPGTPEASVQDLASWHLMSYIPDSTVRGAVAAMRGQYDYHKLLDQTCALMETNAASNHANRFENPRREYNRAPVNQQLRYHAAPVPRNSTPIPSKPSYVPNTIPPNRSNFRATGGNSQPINQSSNTQPRCVNVTQAQDSAQDEIIREEGNFGNEFNGCSVLIGTSQVECESSQNSLKVIPVQRVLKKGLTHLLTDENGKETLIGLPRGPSAIEYLRVLDIPVESLLDPGANVSLISKRCLASIVARKELDLSDFIHPTPHENCQTANGSGMTIISAATLPVIKNGEEIWVEFQVPREKPPYPIILGTNALSTLGFQLLDSHTGKDYLRLVDRAKEPSLNVTTTASSYTITCLKRMTVSPYSISSVKCTSKAPDGTYYGKTGSSNFVASVVGGKLSVRVENQEPVGREVAVREILGSLEPLEEVIMDPKSIATALTDKLTSITVNEIPPNRLQLLLKLLPNPESLLSDEQRCELESLLDEFSDVFALDDSELGRTDMVRHGIELTDHRPIRQAPRAVPFALREQVEKMVADYLERGLIQPSKSSYSNPSEEERWLIAILRRLSQA